VSGRPATLALTVDCVVFDDADRLLLIRRAKKPFTDRYALPGGFVDVGETVEHAALRELQEETGLTGAIGRLVGVYSDPARDPRGHTVSVAFLISVAEGAPQAGDDAAGASFESNWRDLTFAFDHAHIIADARKLIGKP
jgi:8-oxo-dGTP diphosphatase